MGTVFFSWQSDLNRKLNKNFIFNCLEKALREVNRETRFLEPERGEVPLLEADQDTQDVPGHPDIFSTILAKIEKSDIFVPDFSLVTHTEGGKKVPNPNVMIEYGYALKALGASRIIPVMNSHYGDFSNLPFDLRTRRAPISYSLAEDDNEEAISIARDGLVKSLIHSIKLATSDVRENTEATIPNTDTLLSTYIQPLTSMGHMIERGEFGAQKQFSGMFAITLPSGKWDANKLEIAEKAKTNLRPFGKIVDGYRPFRWQNGVEIYEWLERGVNSPREEDIVRKSFSKLFYDGTILGFDKIRQHYSDDELKQRGCRGILIPGYIEKYMQTGLENFIQFYKDQTTFTAPIRVMVGLYNVYDYKLGLPTNVFGDNFSDKILDGNITYSFEVNDLSQNIETLLLPFFEKVWVEAGMPRPADYMNAIKMRA
ncbi:MAG: hypothetical protein COY40_02655 [Alphaproteobacteria bacterium CG_4_10_14_0_8_um_filter_53_9]|nr:MAG: hypothetical protein COY40_02655 [Alphaproteobacteria bacterium CG_4_10_14_0_8_um_filter_53_9]